MPQMRSDMDHTVLLKTTTGLDLPSPDTQVSMNKNLDAMQNFFLEMAGDSFLNWNFPILLELFETSRARSLGSLY